MISGFLKIIAVAFAFLFTYIAELSYQTDYYHANLSLMACASSFASIVLAVYTRSKSLLLYASIYIIAACFYALFYWPAVSMDVYHIFYVSKVNFSLIISIADWLIILAGGINVIYRLYTLFRGNHGSDDIFDACMGVYKWQR